jgi:hypothetical protein
MRRWVVGRWAADIAAGKTTSNTPLNSRRLHIAMRLQHLKQIGDGLAAGDPARAAAKAVIVTDAERLHWRIWNGKAGNTGKSIYRIRAVMHHFRRERDSRKSIAP